MAATRLITMHQNKGKSVAKSLSDRTDYAKNGEKTENGQFISSYACQAESVDEEFMLSKREYERLTGRHPRGNIIAEGFLLRIGCSLNTLTWLLLFYNR